MKLTYRDVINSVLKDSSGDVKAACEALCDGEYLAKSGYQERDMPAIEGAYLKLKSLTQSKTGRPTLFGEPAKEIRFRLPVSEIEKLGHDPNDRAREIVREKLKEG